MSKSPITCHVLDTSTGQPAEGIAIRLQEFQPAKEEGGIETFDPLAEGVTDSDGRCTDLLTPGGRDLLRPGLYKIIFRTKEYFDKTKRQSFYPWVEITFDVKNSEEHYHIPLLISPFGFNTYRGS
ncbi:Hydroxyisourate hydrolase [Marasmius fiardii PR-910]|nr:Hydroxyisourate hydrolase [Marasmius fiardii PR-910]